MFENKRLSGEKLKVLSDFIGIIASAISAVNSKLTSHRIKYPKKNWNLRKTKPIPNN